MFQRHRKRMLIVPKHTLHLLQALREECVCIRHSVLLIFSLNHFHLPPPNRAVTCEVERNGNSRVAHWPAFLLSCSLALLVIHSWAILRGSYVNAWVCFWLGGTKSTLYKCTLKQLPLLPTVASTQTSDCAAAWLAYSGGKDGCRPFARMSLVIRHMCRFWF